MSPSLTWTLHTAVVKLFVHRRHNDAAHRRAANDVASTIADIVRDNLQWIESEKQHVSARLSYSTLMFSATTSILFDGEILTTHAAEDHG